MTHRDKELIHSAKQHLGDELAALAKFLPILAEIESRKAYLEEGFPSLFKYLTLGLNLSESSAAKRIGAARLGRVIPKLFSMIESGVIHLSGAYVLSKYLESKTLPSILPLCVNKSRDEIDRLARNYFASSSELSVASTREVVRLRVRRVLPVEEQSDDGPMTNLKAAFPEPNQECDTILSTEVRLSITLSDTGFKRLERLKQLKPGHNFASIIEKALEMYQSKIDPVGRVERKEPSKFRGDQVQGEITCAQAQDQSTKPRATVTRHIPAAVRHQVYRRDQGQCTFMSVGGMRCCERGRLEFDHIQPFAMGGKHTVENLRLRCRGHNQLAARVAYGEDFMRRKCGGLTFPGK